MDGRALEVVRLNAEELQRRFEQHLRLLERAVEGDDAGHDEAGETCVLPDCPHRRRLRETLAEAIAILEETRKAFKSKRLEALRKRFIRVLAEDA